MSENRMRPEAVLPNEHRERDGADGRGEQPYQNGAGSACGEGNAQGRKGCSLSLWEGRPNALTSLLCYASGGGGCLRGEFYFEMC